MQDRPFQFNGHVRTEPPGAAAGGFKCTVQPQGLYFESKKQQFLIPTGTSTEHLGNNRLRIHLPEYRMVVAVNAQGVYTIRLARDLALFLSGQGAPPQAESYRMPGYFMVLAVLPFGIMAITMGGAIWGGLAGAVCAANYGVLQKEEWPQTLRVGIAVGTTVAAYVAVIALRLSVG
jgi:hypothetical protein